MNTSKILSSKCQCPTHHPCGQNATKKVTTIKETTYFVCARCVSCIPDVKKVEDC